jgi:hypothetical protein
MIKKIGSLMVVLLGLLLLVYSAMRSLDFIELTLPADKKIMAVFGLAALDGGLLAWLLAYLHGSKGGWQRAVSLLMVGVDLLGSVAMFTADTLYNMGTSGITAALSVEQMTNAALALSGIIALNIAATVAFHIVEPEKLREAAEEEAFSRVEEKTLKQIKANAESLAAELAPTLAADWMRQTKAKYTAHLLPVSAPMQIIDAVAVDAKPATPKKRTGKAGKLAGMLFKRPVGVRSLEAVTVGPAELVEAVGTVTGPKADAVQSVANMKPPTRPNIAQASGQNDGPKE